MKMRHKLATYAFIPAVLGLTLVGAGTASAHGMMGGFGFGMGISASPDEIATRQQARFEQEAKILGLSVDDVKQAWAEGKNFKYLAKEKGITEDQIAARVKSAHETQLKNQLQALVSKGVITQAQADARLKVMQDRMQKMQQKLGKKIGRGMRAGAFGF